MSAKLLPQETSPGFNWVDHYKAVRRRLEISQAKVPAQVIRRIVDASVAISMQTPKPKPTPKLPPLTFPTAPPGVAQVYDRPVGPTRCGFLGLDGEPVIKFKYAPRELVAQVAQQHGKTMAELMSDRRSADIVRPRQIAMYRLSVETDWSTVRIGRFFGGRDHTTALHAIRKIQRLVDAGEIAL